MRSQLFVQTSNADVGKVAIGEGRVREKNYSTGYQREERGIESDEEHNLEVERGS